MWEGGKEFELFNQRVKQDKEGFVIYESVMF